MSRIYILSQPVQSGKTSLLLKWAGQQKHVAGILTPDTEGRRSLLEVHTGRRWPMQLAAHEEGIRIGRFVFDSAVFEQARNILQTCMDHTRGWVIVDEVGRLEVNRHEGLEPALGTLINRFRRSPPGDARLLLVIRDYLLEEAMHHYGLEEATVLGKDFFEQPAPAMPAPAGLVLCGGRSTRMGRDKALITYHNKPQYRYVADLMGACCEQVIISCNEGQVPYLDPSYRHLADHELYAGAGPVSGLLSFFEEHPGSAALVCACDYPYFILQDLLQLNASRNEHTDAVCYRNTESGFAEPLLAVYEKQCAPLLLRYFKEGNASLRHFLDTVNTRWIHTDNRHLQSVDE